MLVQHMQRIGEQYSLIFPRGFSHAECAEFTGNAFDQFDFFFLPLHLAILFSTQSRSISGFLSPFFLFYFLVR